jgi:hypothetical protein
MTYQCPVCKFNRLAYPPAGYHICPCCSTEFGNDDAQFSHAQLREMWIGSGAQWFFGNPPINWNPWTQLMEGGLMGAIPFNVLLRSEVNTKIHPLLDLKNEQYPTSLAA